MDGTSNDVGSGSGMMLISPEGHKIHCAIHFGFKASNNDAEYKALIAGLRLARELQVRNVKIFGDSQLVGVLSGCTVHHSLKSYSTIILTSKVANKGRFHKH